MSNATLSFLPWVRQGAAAAINAPATSTNPVATVSPLLMLNGQTGTIPKVSIALRGPADVIGIDANQVVRTDPRPGTADFEPNCFPSIEFDRPDFPWLFTPTQAAGDNRLRPWLCLITVRKQDGVTLLSTPDAPLPTLTIDSPAVPANELPDLNESWAWAHAQVAKDKSEIVSGFAGGPELTLSRLVCPRFLEHDTDYIACVVPAFDVGRKTGLGEPATPGTSEWNLAPAWSNTAKPNSVRLPVYYHWEFRTGQQGDFESLARGLRAGVPEGIGTRTIDVSHPCFDAAGATTVEMEGALIAAPRSAIVPGPPALPDPIPADFKVHLASIINPQSQARASGDTSDPVLAPPMYGRWHAAMPVVFPTGTSWLDELNLDPRWRAAAALGTSVIQRNQEALMASAWEQGAALQQANQRARQMQLSLAVGEVLRQRHFATNGMTDEMALRIAAPAFARLPAGAASMLAYQATRTWLPVAANRAAMRRIGRQRGPLTRRVAAKGNFSRSPDRSWVASLNQTFIPHTPPTQPPPSQYCALPSLPLFTQALQYTTDNPPLPQSYYGVFFVAPEGASVTAPGTLSLQKRAEAPDFFRSAAREHLARVFPPRQAVIQPHFIVSSFGSVKQTVLDHTNPRAVLSRLFNAVVATAERALPPTAKGIAPTGVEMIMVPPHFPQPMYETLREISQDWLLLGVDKVKPDTVLGLQTNRRFVESYMVGLNHEMGRELLWRGYPTDQRGTYFDQFWGNGVPNTAPRDITDLNSWSTTDPITKQLTRQLGDPTGTMSTDKFVMVMRSSLLRRYPNAVIYLAPAKKVGTGPNPDALVPNTATEVLPVFSGSMQPDIVFFGFPVTPDAAAGKDGTLGHYVVIQEHPTEPRFGIDADITRNGTHLSVATPPSSLNVPGWNTHAAAIARIIRRLPVRMAIHAARLISSN